jgi:sarcosine oxidase
MTSIDVIIIGLGVHGSACARELASCGLRVVGVDALASGVVGGASRGPARMFRVMHDKRELVPLALESMRLWEELARSGRRPLYRPARRILIGPADQPELAEVGRAGTRLARDDTTLARLALPSDWVAFADDDAGLLDAPACVLSLREAATVAGAKLLFGARASLPDAPPGPSPVRVRVGPRELSADLALICVGAGMVQLPAWAQPPGLRIEPAHMHVARFAADPVPLGADAFYIIHGESGPFCTIPLGTRQGVQFGHFSPPPGAAGLSVREASAVTWRRDLEALRRYLPGLGRIRQRRTVRAAYTMSADGSFVLRWVAPRVATLSACSGIGFKFAPALAKRVVAALIGTGGTQDALRVEGARS